MASSVQAVVSANGVIAKARNALLLCHDKNSYYKAKQCLVEVKKDGSALVTKTKDAVERLERYEKWLSKEFQNIAERKDKLYREEKITNERISSLNETIRYLESCISENESAYEKANREEARARDTRDEAQDKLDGISTPLVLIPGYVIFWGIRELIEDNSGVVSRAQSTIDRYEQQQRQLRNEKERNEQNILKEREYIAYLKTKITAINCDCNGQDLKLAQTRQAIKVIMMAVELYTKLADLGEETVDNISKLEQVIELAKEIGCEIESSGAARNCKVGLDFLDDFLAGEISSLCLEYTCSRCGKQYNGIPWFKYDSLYCKHCI
jgi:DNA repair exonuclease SbcCD ATPase subunit